MFFKFLDVFVCCWTCCILLICYICHFARRGCAALTDAIKDLSKVRDHFEWTFEKPQSPVLNLLNHHWHLDTYSRVPNKRMFILNVKSKKKKKMIIKCNKRRVDLINGVIGKWFKLTFRIITTPQRNKTKRQLFLS